MTALAIGTWVQRPDRRAKWHRVESVIAGAAITRCGKRLERATGGVELVVSEGEPFSRLPGQPQNCQNCG